MWSDTRRPRVLLGGWYGAANLGDELLLGTFARWVREAGGEAIAISVNPHYTRHAHEIEAVGYGDLPAIAEAMAGADLFVLGGGGLFQDYDPIDRASLERFPALNVTQFAQFAALAREFAVPYAALAQGVGPLRHDEGRGIARDVFEGAVVATVRDDESLALLRAIGVTREVAVAPDPAWAFRAAAVAPAMRFPELAGRRVLALVVRDWPFDPAWEDAFVEAFRAGVPSSWGCLWLDFTRVPGASPDRPVHIEIAPRLIPRLPGPAHALWQGMRIEEAAALLAGSDALLAMRLHGALLGHAHGLPVLALEYDGKVRALGDGLGMPQAQRLSLADIAVRLPGALERLTSDPAAFVRVPPWKRDALAAATLTHRELLRSATAVARPAMPTAEPLLPRWAEALDAAGCRRVMRALLERLARVSRQ